LYLEGQQDWHRARREAQKLIRGFRFLLKISAGQRRRAQADREARARGYGDSSPKSGRFLPSIASVARGLLEK